MSKFKALKRGCQAFSEKFFSPSESPAPSPKPSLQKPPAAAEAPAASAAAPAPPAAPPASPPAAGAAAARAAATLTPATPPGFEPIHKAKLAERRNLQPAKEALALPGPLSLAEVLGVSFKETKPRPAAKAKAKASPAATPAETRKRLQKKLASIAGRFGVKYDPETRVKPDPLPPPKAPAVQQGPPSLAISLRQKAELETYWRQCNQRRKPRRKDRAKRQAKKTKIFICRTALMAQIKALSKGGDKLLDRSKAATAWLKAAAGKPENQKPRANTAAVCISDWHKLRGKMRMNSAQSTEALKAFYTFCLFAQSKSKFYKPAECNYIEGFGLNNSFAKSRSKTKNIAFLKKIIKHLAAFTWIQIAKFDRLCFCRKRLYFRAVNLWTAFPARPARAPP